VCRGVLIYALPVAHNPVGAGLAPGGTAGSPGSSDPGPGHGRGEPAARPGGTCLSTGSRPRANAESRDGSVASAFLFCHPPAEGPGFLPVGHTGRRVGPTPRREFRVSRQPALPGLLGITVWMIVWNNHPFCEGWLNGFRANRMFNDSLNRINKEIQNTD